MADTGYNWGSWTAVTADTTALTSYLMDDNNTITSDAISLDGYAACLVSGVFELTNSAPDNDYHMYIFHDLDGTLYESTASGYGPYGIDINAVQDSTSGATIMVDPASCNSFKVGFTNESGQSGYLWLKYMRATIPVAS